MADVLSPPYGARDAHGMTALIRAIPEQIEAAVAACDRAPWLPGVEPDLLAAGALGGSAIAADLTAGAFADRLPRPLVVVREYRWPAFVSSRSLALLCSYSGNTEETLALYDEAGVRGIPRVAMTTGGTLGERCARDRVPVALLEPGMPPRAAVYAAWVRMTALVHALGWTSDPAPSWREAAALLARRRGEWEPEVPEARNPAKQLARRLHGRFVFLYAADRLGALATRVRNQLNENAKLLAHSAVAPELNHNEVAGWERQGPLASRAAVLILRDADDSPEVHRRLTLTAEFVAKRGAHVVELREEEGSRLARIASLVQLGDWLSLYLALLDGADPTPIESIDWFKQRLAESRTA